MFGPYYSKKNHSVFFSINQEKYILIVVYKDDIMMTEGDIHEIRDKDTFIVEIPLQGSESLWFFFGIKMARTKKRLLYFGENIC